MILSLKGAGGWKFSFCYYEPSLLHFSFNDSWHNQIKFMGAKLYVLSYAERLKKLVDMIYLARLQNSACI